MISPVKIYALIWDKDLQNEPFFKRWPLLALRLVIAVVRDVDDGNLSLRATSLVYTTLLAFAPLLAITFSVLKGFGVHNQIEPFLREFLLPLGAQSADITERIIEFVDNINVGVLGALGVALLIYSVISLMAKIETAFNEIWGVPNTRPFVLRIRDYLGVLLIGPLFLFLSVAITTSLKNLDFFARFMGTEIFNLAFEKTFVVLPFVLFALAFAAIYAFMPNTRVKLIPALVAGVITGVLWKALGYLFGVFVTGSGSYAAIYSAFAALVLFMIWLYVGWLIVLIGASISYYLQNPSNQRLPRRFRQLSLRVKEKLALMVLTEIGKDFYAQKPAPTLGMLARRMNVPARAVGDVVEDLVTAGFLVDNNDGYMPGRPFDTTSIFDTLKALRAADEAGSIEFTHLRSSETTDRILDLSEKATRVVLGNITLKQLCFGEVNT